jgi:hypothetical protein
LPPSPAGGGREPSSRPTPARPTPVRDLMAREDASRSKEEELREVSGEGDDTWYVRVGGTQRTGTAPDRGATLLLLLFQRSREGEDPEREVWAPARSLDELTDEALLGFLEKSRPYRAPEEPAAPGAAERRRRRGSGRRGRG